MAGEDVLMYTVVFPLGTVGFVGMLALFVYNDIITKPVKAYRACRNKPNKTCALYLKSSGNAFLRDDAKYISGVYEIENEKAEELLAFTKNDKGSFKLGQAILEIFYDGANMTINPEMMLAIEALKKKGYNTIDDLKKAIEEKRFSPFADDELGVEVKLHKEPDKGWVYIPLFKAIDPRVVQGYVLGNATIFKSFCDTKVTMERLKAMKTGLGDPKLQWFFMIILAAALGLGIMKAMKVF